MSRRPRQRERQKSNGLNKQNKNSVLALYFFLSLNLDLVFRNSPQGQLARISLHILFLIIALKKPTQRDTF